MAEVNNTYTVDGYDLNMPDRKMAMQSLEGMFGNVKADAIWLEVCKDVEIQPDSKSIDELSKAFVSMSKKEGTLGVLGRSLSIRATSYRILSRIKNIK